MRFSFIFATSLATLSALLVWILPDLVFAQDFTYQPLAPIPGTETGVDARDPSSFLVAFLRAVIVIAAVYGVVKLMVCGFKYMTSEAPGAKGDAKGCIWSVISGIFLILLSYVILLIINPDLTKIRFGDIKNDIRDNITVTTP